MIVLGPHMLCGPSTHSVPTSNACSKLLISQNVPCGAVLAAVVGLHTSMCG